MTFDTARWSVLAPLLQAATAGRDLLASTIRGLGAEAVTQVVLAEIGEHDVRLDLHFDGTTTSHLATAADIVVTLDLVDAVRGLFGTDERPWPSLAVRTKYEDLGDRHPGEWFAAREGNGRKIDPLLTALRPAAPDLGSLAVAFGSDKWADLHWYTALYARHLGHLRTEPVRVLEIGIGGYGDPAQGGGSLRMWQRYFRRGLVHGLDLYPKEVTGPRIMTIQGDQNDPEFLDSLGRELGPFDVIVDDGSHVNEHVLTSFHALFPHVRPGGTYVVEDLQTAYWPKFGGSPDGGEGTSIGLLK